MWPRFDVTREWSSSKTTYFRVLEEAFGFLIGEQKRYLLRRRQQDIGRIELLALSLGVRRIAGAVLDGDGQAHLPYRLHEVALDIDSKCLQRRDIERVDACKGRHPAGVCRGG